MLKQLDMGYLNHSVESHDWLVARNRHDYEFIYFYPPTRVLCRMGPDDVYGEVLQRPETERCRSMYVHIPFCTGRCTYCHYARFTRPSNATSDFEEYLAGIRNEVKLLNETAAVEQMPLETLHFGGGTPTLLSARQIDDLMTFLRSQVSLAWGAEITWEATPETLLSGNDFSKIRTLLRAGVNRLSVGVQSFEDDLLHAMCRRHCGGKAIQAVEVARQAGFANINIDLIYGLPDQTMHHWERTLDTVGTLRPESVTCYQLRVKQGTPISRLDPSRFPDESQCSSMGQVMLDRLADFGYRPWQPNQFVLDEMHVHKYLKSKWEGRAKVIGIGVSAYSFVNNCMYVNHRALPEYYESIRAGRLPIWVGKKLSWKQQVAKAIVLGIKVLPNGVDKGVFAERFGIRPEDLYADTIRTLAEADLVESSPRCLRLTKKGLLLADEVCTEFYADEDKEALGRMGATRYGSYFDPL